MDLIAKNETISTNSFWDFKGNLDFVDQWFLMGTPFPILFIWLSYMIFVLKLGPEFMKNRPAYNLKNTLAMYNAAQVALSVYMFCVGFGYIWQTGLIHKECLMSKEDTQKFITSGNYIYLCAKITELLDTIFFVLRKKQSQATFLHVYHHSIMVLSTWVVLKYNPTDSPLFLATLNSFVHMIMYSYYGLSTFPQVAKYLWLKKYITSLQLIQFVMVLIEVTIHHVISECPPSYVLLLTMYSNGFLFIYLFGSFYKQSYVKKNEKKVIGHGKISSTDNVNGKDNNINDFVNYNGTQTSGLKYTNGHINNRNKISNFIQ